MGGAPMLHHHSSSANMWDPCIGAPPPASLRAPKTAPQPPVAPSHTKVASSIAGRASRAKPASISASRASHAEPASATISCASLRQAGLRPLLQTMPHQSEVAVCHALG
ncbi:Os05g0499666 [Oryza sativa Japonica Group]|uniref:Os05g0499666 protein n=1 Tax=Oryza sativa subsp. japonica TaxID=39947 RepID=A0A0P0WP84_ORYSJ|nr:Os05g0499666 [Oryza sativa Japonica Group]